MKLKASLCILLLCTLLTPVLGCKNNKTTTPEETNVMATETNIENTTSAPTATPRVTPEPTSPTVVSQLNDYQKFLDKAKSGQPVNVAFLGGSITAGASYANWGKPNTFTGTNIDGTPIDVTQYWSYASSDDMRDSWRGLVYSWLVSKYQTKENQFKQINAAIGGTDSNFGALRLDDHVFSQGIPDLILIEYVVNDNGKTDQQMMTAYESIITRIKAKNPDCAIFFPFSTARQKIDMASPAMYDAVQKSMVNTKKYADFKKIPYAIIDNAYYHGSLTDAQKTALYYGPKEDAGVHPSPYGYQVYAQEVERVLTDCFKNLSFTFDNVTLTVPKGSPATAKIIFGEQLTSQVTGSTTNKLMDDPRQHKCLSYHQALISNSTAAELNYTFKGTAIWLWMDSNYANCKLDVYVDGTIALTDWYAAANQATLVKNLLDAGKTHTIRIVPKSANNTANPFAMAIRGLCIENYSE